jgi:hypothetical protein
MASLFTIYACTFKNVNDIAIISRLAGFLTDSDGGASIFTPTELINISKRAAFQIITHCFATIMQNSSAYMLRIFHVHKERCSLLDCCSLVKSAGEKTNCHGR